jgi:hypothetical protein
MFFIHHSELLCRGFDLDFLLLLLLLLSKFEDKKHQVNCSWLWLCFFAYQLEPAIFRV